tara:strand:- start:3005 stop:3178 length:174 start_codon:yes stop_codon:yes gene_type:complete
MARLEQYLVETPCGEKFKVFAANAYDAGKQVMAKITFKNSLVVSNSIVSHEKFRVAE